MISYEDEIMTVTCDECGEEHERICSTWHEGIDYFKELEWRFKLVEETKQWLHICRNCRMAQDNLNDCPKCGGLKKVDFNSCWKCKEGKKNESDTGKQPDN